MRAGNHEIMLQKTASRRLLNSEVDEFLKNGGEIIELKGVEFKSKPARVIYEESQPRYATGREVNQIRKWANDGGKYNGRRALLCSVTGISRERIYHLIAPNSAKNMTKSEFKLLRDAIQFIEENITNLDEEQSQ